MKATARVLIGLILLLCGADVGHAAMSSGGMQGCSVSYCDALMTCGTHPPAPPARVASTAPSGTLPSVFGALLRPASTSESLLRQPVVPPQIRLVAQLAPRPPPASA